MLSPEPTCGTFTDVRVIPRPRPSIHRLVLFRADIMALWVSALLPSQTTHAFITAPFSDASHWKQEGETQMEKLSIKMKLLC